MNDPEHQAAGLAKHLAENGIGKYFFGICICWLNY